MRVNDIAVALKDLLDFIGQDGGVRCEQARKALGCVVYTLHRYEDALKLPLMFYASSWDANRERWHRITGEREATTEVMCDQIRRVLTGEPGGGEGSRLGDWVRV